MKNLSIIFTVLTNFMFVQLCVGQDTDFRKAIVHSNKEIFRVTKDKSNRMTIRSIDNKLYNMPDGSKALSPINDRGDIIRPRTGDITSDKRIATHILYETFSEKRIKELADENLNLLVSFYVDLDGNIKEMDFSFNNSSKISPLEIEELEQTFKKQIKFKINQELFKGQIYVNTFYSINFKMLLNRSDHAVN